MKSIRRLLIASVALPLACGGSGSEEAAPGGSGAGQTGASGASGKASAGAAGAAGAKAGASGHTAGNAGTAQAGKSGAGQAGAAGNGAGGGGGAGASGLGGAGGKSGGGQAGGAGQAGSGGQSGGSGGKAGAGGTTQPKPLSLAVTPGTATLTVVDGAPVTQSYTARVVYTDGTLGPPLGDATWKLSPGSFASIGAGGLVTAAGKSGGEETVIASWMGFSADAKLVVKVATTLGGGDVAPGSKPLLDAPTGAGGGPFLYPYDASVFPRGLSAPRLMWTHSQGDEMEFSFSSAYATIKAYAKPSAGSFTLPEDVWSGLLESGKGGPIDVRVTRLAQGASSATEIVKQTWHGASGALRGTVYYWAVNTGRVMRIKPGQQAEDFLQPQGMQCPSCHTVSANGKSLIMNVGTWPQESSYNFDLLGQKTTYSGLSSGGGGASRWAQAAVSADGAVIVQNFSQVRGNVGVDTGAFDAVTAQLIPNSGLEGKQLHNPAFSPDNELIAYTLGGPGPLAVMDWDPVARKASNERVLVQPGGDPKLQWISFPSVTPDHKWVVYQRGSALGSIGSTANLYMASVDSPGVEIALGNLNGATYPFAAGARDRDLNFEPTIAPQAAGGYYWIVFHSRRTYGNALTGQASCGEGCGTKQLWLAPIDQSPVAGKDPSHPAVWVPGQELSTLNMRGYWALDACKDDGAGCSAASECCTGLTCLPSTMKCGTPPNQTCKPTGAKCGSAAECCGFAEGYQCVNGFCTEPKP